MESKIYTQVSDVKEAHAVAKAFQDKTNMVDYPFKFPAIKPYEIRGRILATGICHTDVHIAKTELYTPHYPLVPGHEVIAIVTEVGADVKDFKVGQRVGMGLGRAFCGKCGVCEKGLDNLCQADVAPETHFLYDPYFGGFATHIQVTQQAAFHIPENLPTDRAPPLLCAGMTMFAALQRHCSKGQKIGIIGIGGLGHLGVKYANKMGCHVTALTSKPKEKEEELKKMGAHEVISSIDPADFKKHEFHFDVLLNTFYSVDSTLINSYIHMLRSGGTYVQVALPDQHVAMPQININEICLRQILFAGTIISSAQEMKDMLKFSSEHNVLPDCEIFEWEDFEKAFDKCAKGTARYRCVVNVERYAQKLGLK